MDPRLRPLTTKEKQLSRLAQRKRNRKTLRATGGDVGAQAIRDELNDLADAFAKTVVFGSRDDPVVDPLRQNDHEKTTSFLSKQTNSGENDKETTGKKETEIVGSNEKGPSSDEKPKPTVPFPLETVVGFDGIEKPNSADTDGFGFDIPRIQSEPAKNLLGGSDSNPMLTESSLSEQNNSSSLSLPEQIPGSANNTNNLTKTNEKSTETISTHPDRLSKTQMCPKDADAPNDTDTVDLNALDSSSSTAWDLGLPKTPNSGPELFTTRFVTLVAPSETIDAFFAKPDAQKEFFELVSSAGCHPLARARGVQHSLGFLMGLLPTEANTNSIPTNCVFHRLPRLSNFPQLAEIPFLRARQKEIQERVTWWPLATPDIYNAASINDWRVLFALERQKNFEPYTVVMLFSHETFLHHMSMQPNAFSGLQRHDWRFAINGLSSDTLDFVTMAKCLLRLGKNLDQQTASLLLTYRSTLIEKALLGSPTDPRSDLNKTDTPNQLQRPVSLSKTPIENNNDEGSDLNEKENENALSESNAPASKETIAIAAPNPRAPRFRSNWVQVLEASTNATPSSDENPTPSSDENPTPSSTPSSDENRDDLQPNDDDDDDDEDDEEKKKDGDGDNGEEKSDDADVTGTDQEDLLRADAFEGMTQSTSSAWFCCSRRKN